MNATKTATRSTKGAETQANDARQSDPAIPTASRQSRMARAARKWWQFFAVAQA